VNPTALILIGTALAVFSYLVYSSRKDYPRRIDVYTGWVWTPDGVTPVSWKLDLNLLTQVGITAGIVLLVAGLLKRKDS
jgi:hypothetical protein